MWASSYWANSYWAPTYWSQGVAGMDGLVLTVGGVDRTALLLVNTLLYTDRENGRTNLAFKLQIKGTPPYSPKPVAGQPVELFNNGSKVFSGKLDKVREVEKVRNTGLVITCTCVDHSTILDRYVAAKILAAQTAGDMVKDLMGDFVPAAEGINTDDVQDGLTVEKAVFGYRKMSSALDELSKVSGFMWFVDVNKRLQFFTRATFNASFNLSAGSNNYRKPDLTKTLEQYRNKQFLRAGEDTTDSRTEDFQGDTERRTFTVGFRIAEEPTVTLNAASQTIGVRGIDDESAFDWLWRKGEKEITQGTGGTTLIGTDVLQVTFKGLFRVVVVDEDTSEITDRIAIEGGAGRYEEVEDDDSIESRDFALQKVAGLLRRFGVVPDIFKYETDVDGLKAGMLQNVNLPDLGINDDFLIDEVRARDVDAAIVRYTVTALSGEHLGSWFEFFRKLQDAGRTFRLDADETLGLVRKFTEGLEAAEAFDTATALGAFTADPYTGFQWGTATEARGFWGHEEDVANSQVATGSQWTNPPVDA